MTKVQKISEMLLEQGRRDLVTSPLFTSGSTMKKSTSRNYTRRGKTYPDQSKRQELRGQRVQQGGPGLTTGKDPQPRTAK